VQITVDQFEAVSSHEAALAAQWEIFMADGLAPLRAGHFRKAKTDSGTALSPSIGVQLQSELLGDFSRMLAEVLRDMSSS
jgi:hypothetical protein